MPYPDVIKILTEELYQEIERFLNENPNLQANVVCEGTTLKIEMLSRDSTGTAYSFTVAEVDLDQVIYIKYFQRTSGWTKKTDMIYLEDPECIQRVLNTLKELCSRHRIWLDASLREPT